MAEPLSYKEQKELWVSGYEGGSRVEIAVVLSCSHLLVLMRNLLRSWLFGNSHSNTRWSFLVDFFCLLLPQLLAFTVLADQVHSVISALIFTSVALLFLSDKVANVRKHPSKVLPFSWQTICNIPMGSRRDFITNYRAYMNIGTAICILAVDFGIFPRRFCKAETYGTGLMDIGVGSFIISNAIVSAEARDKYPNLTTLSQKAGSVVRSIWTSLPLLVLGIARFLAVKGSDYHEHVSEYGIHWNFFFTLAIVKILSTCLLCAWPPSFSWLLAIGISAGYQWLLTGCQLNELVLFGTDGQGSRDGFLNANREGIFSSLGYLALFFAAVQLGRLLMRPRSRLADWLWCLLALILLSVGLHLLLYYCETSIEPVSRRMANMQYCIWMLAMNIELVACYLLIDILCCVVHHQGLIQQPTRASGDGKKSIESFCLLEAINRNGLFYFLLANVLTGLVNLVVPTLSVSSSMALAILSGYLFILSVALGLLHVYKITLRL